MTKLWFVILVAGIDVVCVGAAESPADRETSREASKANFDAVWQYVKPAIFGSNKAVRLYYRANCHVIRDFVGQDPVPLPSVKVQPPSKDKTGLVALVEIFKNDKNVTVTEEPQGIIRIRVGEAAMETLRLRMVNTMTGAVAEPMKGLPHLPASIRNVTMEQALDKIAKTWAGEGVVIYRVCTEPTQQNGDTLFWLDYAGDIVPK
jgi:hypothetical protein